MADIQVREDPGTQRFVITVDGEQAGFTAYDVRAKGYYALTHTEIDPSREGQGLGSILIRSTLDDLRGRGVGVLPYCPFVRRYLSRHPEYLDVVPEERRSQFGLS